MKSLPYILILIFLSLPLWAFQAPDGKTLKKGADVGFSAEPQFGWMMGQARELVYKESNQPALLSELIWDLSNIFFVGGSVSLNVNERFFLNGGLMVGLNPGNGQMMDFDWLSGTTHNGYGRTGWTNWSLSDIQTRKAILWDVNSSVNLLKRGENRLSLRLGFRQFNFDWTDKVIDYIYPSGGSNPDHLNLLGKNAIDYQLLLHIPYLGVGGLINLKGWTLEGQLAYSPYVIAEDHDYHKLNNSTGGTHYRDIAYGGQYFSFSLKGGYAFTDWFSLNLQILGQYLFEMRGDVLSYLDGSTSITKSAGKAGMQFQAISVNIGTTFSF